MKFVLPGTNDEFEIPDDWWHAAGMSGYTPSRTHFCWKPRDDVPIELRLITAIETPRRGPDFGFPIKQDRMIRILRGIRDDQPLPAIGVTPLADGAGPFRYKLYCGFHRLYASAAVGFSYIPAFVPSEEVLALALRSAARR